MKDYKKILEGVVNIINTTEKSDIGFANICTYIGENCPELKESEDERIRKAIKKALQVRCDGSRIISDEPVTLEEAIAWLEKQCEHANFRNKIQVGDEVTRNEDGVLVNLSQLQRVVKPAENTDKQEEQSPADKVEPKFKVGQIIKKEGFNLGFTIVKIEDGFYYNDMGDYFPFTDQDNWELVEQKPAWSEEDEKVLHAIRNALNYEKPRNYLKSRDFEFTDILDWLKSLKYRVQPKQEWSEEDENIFRDIVARLHSHPDVDKTEYDKSYHWLKDLKERYTLEAE